MSVSGCRGSPGFRVFLHHVTPADLQVVVVVVVNVEHRAVSSVGGGGLLCKHSQRPVHASCFDLSHGFTVHTDREVEKYR